MKYVRIGISMAIVVLVFISLYIPTNDYVVWIEDGVIKTSEDKEIKPIEKTLDGEIDRLSMKYSVSSSTVREIIKCESSMYGSAIHINNDGSRDWGWMQINDRYHKSSMERFGLDITNQWDSLEFGFILMDEQGLRPWIWSKPCWKDKI